MIKSSFIVYEEHASNLNIAWSQFLNDPWLVGRLA